jgi:site-specific recombinase XerC
VSKLLGHSQLSTTQRYAHLSNEKLLDAANAAGRIATGTLAGAGTTPSK